MVGAKDVDFKKHNWFWDFEWTEKQQDKFIVWLASYLKKNKEARKELMAFSSLKEYEKVAKQFVFQYGWKTKALCKKNK